MLLSFEVISGQYWLLNKPGEAILNEGPVIKGLQNKPCSRRVVTSFQPLAVKMQLGPGKYSRPELSNQFQQDCYRPFQSTQAFFLKYVYDTKSKFSFSKQRLMPCIEVHPWFESCVMQGEKCIFWRRNKTILWLKLPSLWGKYIQPEQGRWEYGVSFGKNVNRALYCYSYCC